jgi:hypothetical protein
MKKDDLAANGAGLTDYFLGQAKFPPLATIVTFTATTAFYYVSQ